jgi:hypothetical protein
LIVHGVFQHLRLNGPKIALVINHVSVRFVVKRLWLPQGLNIIDMEVYEFEHIWQEHYHDMHLWREGNEPPEDVLRQNREKCNLFRLKILQHRGITLRENV